MVNLQVDGGTKMIKDTKKRLIERLSVGEEYCMICDQIDNETLLLFLLFSNSSSEVIHENHYQVAYFGHCLNCWHTVISTTGHISHG